MKVDKFVSEFRKLSSFKMNSKLTIASDLFLPLRLYQIPEKFLQSLSQFQPMVEILEVNTPSTHSLVPIDAEVYFGNRITKEIIQKMPHLKWIQFGSIGVEKSHCPEVLERKIRVTNGRGTMESYVATHALAMILAFCRGFHCSSNLKQNFQMGRENFDACFDTCGDLENKSVLLVGFGCIGKILGRICSLLGMKVNVIQKSNKNCPDYVKFSGDLKLIENAVKGVDFVVNLLPLTSETRWIFNYDFFLKMERHAFFINVGRGETVREDDLIRALRENKIAGAGLDVFEKEPLENKSPLLSFGNTILSPHVAGLGSGYWEKILYVFLVNINNFLRGEPLINQVDVKKGY
jgi:phosphoglycerate dehydrogenase-like enzyme